MGEMVFKFKINSVGFSKANSKAQLKSSSFDGIFKYNLAFVGKMFACEMILHFLICIENFATYSKNKASNLSDHHQQLNSIQ